MFTKPSQKAPDWSFFDIVKIMEKAKEKIDLEKSQDADWNEVSEFFALLLEIDIKNNPHLYKKKYGRHNTINSTSIQSDQISR